MRARVLLLILLLGCGVCGCTSVFLHPDQVRYLPNLALGTPAEDLRIAAPDGSDLHALYLPAHGTPRATLLFLHGNAENLSSHIHAVAWLPAQGYNVLAIDYRGYGRSQGVASVDAIHEDAEAALAWLAARDTGTLIIYGQSLGASIAIRLATSTAAHERVVAVIAESAFSSYRDIAREKLSQLWLTWPLQWPLSMLISDQYAAIKVVHHISPIPLLLIHGEHDVIVSVSHSRRLYEAAREPKKLWLIPEGRHIDATRRESVRGRFLDFLNSVTAPDTRPFQCLPS
ncbi:MAG: alpha/beta hydrolase [Panacagrimonas sp.]